MNCRSLKPIKRLPDFNDCHTKPCVKHLMQAVRKLSMPFSIQMQGKNFQKIGAEVKDLFFNHTKQPPSLTGFSVTGGA